MRWNKEEEGELSGRGWEGWAAGHQRFDQLHVPAAVVRRVVAAVGRPPPAGARHRRVVQRGTAVRVDGVDGGAAGD